MLQEGAFNEGPRYHCFDLNKQDIEMGCMEQFRRVLAVAGHVRSAVDLLRAYSVAPFSCLSIETANQVWLRIECKKLRER